MRFVKPDYYDEFTCIAGACRHTCCSQGWEIDVDEEALAFYETVPGEFGQRLRESLVRDEEGVHFRLIGEEERCPLLNERNLCDLILTLGEDHLCQICADHPRFRSFFEERTEMGVGLCCEEAARLILTRQAPLTLIEDGGKEEVTPWECEILDVRDEAFGILQDRTKPIALRWEEVLELGEETLPKASPEGWGDFLRSLERLEADWDRKLGRLRGKTDFTPVPKEFDLPLEQLTSYFLYRHLPGALLDWDLKGRISFCVLSAMLVWELTEEKTMDCLLDTARRYSSEIEYSEDNICAFLDELDI